MNEKNGKLRPLQNDSTYDESDKENNNDQCGSQLCERKENEKMTLSQKIISKSSMLRDLEGDKLHVLILLFLYCLQGIPLGLRSSIPLILSKKGVSYSEQAEFTISAYPFSMKVLWAPIIDSLYLSRFGRRKSWLVPVQYLIGITMLISSQYVTGLLGDSEINNKNSSVPGVDDDLFLASLNETAFTDFDEEGFIASQAASINDTSFTDIDTEDSIEPDVTALTVMFFILYFLAATQDVVVDGWALTMLKPSNVGYASTCNAVGQQAGWVLGFVVFTSLESRKIVTLSQFILICGIIFLITTTCIAFFMKEKDKSTTHSKKDDSTDDSEQELELSFFEAYKVLWKIIKNPLVLVTVFFLFTFDFPFSAAESIYNLQLIEMGVPKDTIAQLALPMIPVKVLVTFVVTKYTVGPRPLDVFLGSYPFRMLMCLALTTLVYVTPLLQSEDKSFPPEYYALVILLIGLHRAFVYAMFVAEMAFFARVSDPAVGGTYMTLLNTLANLGSMWSATFTLWFVEQVTEKTCVFPEELSGSMSPTEFVHNHTIISPSFPSYSETENTCKGSKMIKMCEDAEGKCVTVSNGFYLTSVTWTVIGVIWLIWAFRSLRKLQETELQKWRVINKVDIRKEKEEKFKYFYCF